ncbi:unnamed protein product [Arctogadus glacialis]
MPSNSPTADGPTQTPENHSSADLSEGGLNQASPEGGTLASPTPPHRVGRPGRKRKQLPVSSSRRGEAVVRLHNTLHTRIDSDGYSYTNTPFICCSGLKVAISQKPS